MSTLAMSIHLPPTGELEISGNGSSPTEDEMAEEMGARQSFLDIVSPFFETLPNRPSRRSGNISSIELLGGNVWSQLNRYLLLVTVDIGDPRIDRELLAMLPEGTRISVVGAYGSLQTWPEAQAAASRLSAMPQPAVATH